MENFKSLLTYSREKAGLTKTDLANAISKSRTYIINLENGKEKPPSIELCKEIARALRLSSAEIQKFIDTAMEERLSPEVLLWLTEKQNVNLQTSKTGLPPWANKLDRLINDNPAILEALQDPDVMEALSDPIILKSLKSVSRNKENFRDALRTLLERFPKMDQEKRLAILALCK